MWIPLRQSRALRMSPPPVRPTSRMIRLLAGLPVRFPSCVVKGRLSSGSRRLPMLSGKKSSPSTRRLLLRWSMTFTPSPARSIPHLSPLGSFRNPLIFRLCLRTHRLCALSVVPSGTSPRMTSASHGRSQPTVISWSPRASRTSLIMAMVPSRARTTTARPKRPAPWIVSRCPMRPL